MTMTAILYCVISGYNTWLNNHVCPEDPNILIYLFYARGTKTVSRGSLFVKKLNNPNSICNGYKFLSFTQRDVHMLEMLECILSVMRFQDFVQDSKDV